MDRTDRIKDILYGAIAEIGEGRIQDAIAEGDSRGAIDMILGAARMGAIQEEDTAGLLTALLHYLLALAMIPSQRKVCRNGTEVDIVIPSLKTLELRPKDAILICIPGIRMMNVEEQAKLAESIQPEGGNIWYVSEEPSERRTYAIRDKSIHRIMDDIGSFLASRKTGPFRLFRI